jgi:hypothetical protein
VHLPQHEGEEAVRRHLAPKRLDIRALPAPL